jgi:hypothetical protein
MTVGSHGVWHRSWQRLDERRITEELVEARVRIAAVAGNP